MKPVKTIDDFPAGTFLRRCQECLNYQEAKDPQHKMTDSYAHAECKRCHSEGSLDYGSIRK